MNVHGSLYLQFSPPCISSMLFCLFFWVGGIPIQAVRTNTVPIQDLPRFIISNFCSRKFGVRSRLLLELHSSTVTTPILFWQPDVHVAELPSWQLDVERHNTQCSGLEMWSPRSGIISLFNTDWGKRADWRPPTSSPKTRHSYIHSFVKRTIIPHWNGPLTRSLNLKRRHAPYCSNQE